MKNSIRLDRSRRQQKYYYIASIIVIAVLAFLFTFPLYWIITGAFRTKKEIMATEPVWFPSEWTMKNFENLMDKRSAPLFDFTIPALKIEAFGYVFKLGETLKITGPTVPAALRWLVNTVFMSVSSMLITCLTSAMAGYALAKKRFFGRGILYGLIVCAMALPKQVILIPMLREMIFMIRTASPMCPWCPIRDCTLRRQAAIRPWTMKSSSAPWNPAWTGHSLWTFPICWK